MTFIVSVKPNLVSKTKSESFFSFSHKRRLFRAKFQCLIRPIIFSVVSLEIS